LWCRARCRRTGAANICAVLPWAGFTPTSASTRIPCSLGTAKTSAPFPIFLTGSRHFAGARRGRPGPKWE
jgi:hypothetical protein